MNDRDYDRIRDYLVALVADTHPDDLGDAARQARIAAAIEGDETAAAAELEALEELHAEIASDYRAESRCHSSPADYR